MNIKVSVHGKNCVGCLREGKPIMISLDGKDSEGVFKFLDAFLTNEEVEELITELRNIMLENEKENKWQNIQEYFRIELLRYQQIVTKK